MMFVRVQGTFFGGTRPTRVGDELSIGGEIRSRFPLESAELLVNGEPRPLHLDSARGQEGTHVYRVRTSHKVTGSSWVALRCFEGRPQGRVRFAHSAPAHLEVEGRPLRPRRVEVEYLIRRVEHEIERSQGVLPESALVEYRRALEIYRARLTRAQ